MTIDFRTLRGLYAITQVSNESDDVTLLHQVKAALAGGARVLQYRDKRPLPAPRRYSLARRLQELCVQNQARFIINDDIALAQQCQADGVHLGQTDQKCHLARQTLGPDAIIGISCHNSLELAVQAAQAQASYVAFGRFFCSSTKPNAPLAPVALLSQAKQLLSLPIVAIGGLTTENGKELVAAGADMLATVEGLFSSSTIEDTAKQFNSLFAGITQPRWKT